MEWFAIHFLYCMKQPHPAVLSKIEDFFQSGKTMVYKRGESILRGDDIPVGVYYLKHGNVRQYLISPTGMTFIVHIYKVGSFFPLTWILNDTPNMYHFDALTEVTISRASKNTFVSFLKQNSDVLFYATQKLAAGLHGLVTRVGQLVIDDAYTKTVLLLLYYAENFGAANNEGLWLRVPLAHREIASWIGTTRETVSLSMESLKNKGLVKNIGRKIVIPDVDVLRKEITPGK